MRKLFIATPIMGLLCFVVPQAYAAFDMTGTWKGTQVCNDLTEGVAENYLLQDDIVEISQQGMDIRMTGLGLLYEGVGQRTAGPIKGEAVVSVCGGEFEAQEIVRIQRIQTGGAGQGSWDAISIFESKEYPGIEGDENFSSCKWVYERISTDDPNVPGCND